jgi:hypothetical protein
VLYGSDSHLRQSRRHHGHSRANLAMVPGGSGGSRLAGRSQEQLRSPGLHERIAVAIAGGRALGEGQGCDCPVPGSSRAGWVETIHAPLPSAAAYWLKRARATIPPSTIQGHAFVRDFDHVKPLTWRGAGASNRGPGTGASVLGLPLTHRDPLRLFSQVRGFSFGLVRPYRTNGTLMACRRSGVRIPVAPPLFRISVRLLNDKSRDSL